MSDLQVRGPLYGGTGTASPFTADSTGAQRTTDAHARYLDAVRNGNVFQLSVAAGAATAYTGAAAGTPLAAIMNPLGSGKLAVVLAVGLASRVAASGAGTVTFNLWGGVSVNPTGTATSPLNLLSLVNSGASCRGFANAALTGSTALGLLLPLASYYWATAAGAIIAPTFFDVAGLAVAIPGNMIALGATAALTSATYDVSIIWEEIPYLP